jgi:predicted MFS family arabinose efflux permease
MAGANLAAPLYQVYARQFGFSSLVLTLVFATYAFVLVPTLLVFGRLSDRFGRRPVLLAGLGAACAGLGLFAAATSTPWLFAARGLQGLAVGMISGTATAVLVELDSKGDRRPALLAGVAQACGSALGPIVAGVLAEWAPEPTRLCYLVLLAVTAVAAVFVATLPAERRGREPWRVQWPRVPADLRADFARVGLTAALAWGAVALFFSIVPSYASRFLESRNLALFGAVASVGLAASCVSQLVARRLRRNQRRVQAAGLAAVATGLIALALAAPLGSLALLLAGGTAVGAGHGLGIFDAQDELNMLAPGERRGEVTAAFVCCIYLVVAASVIATGLLDVRLALSTAVGVVAAVLAAAAFATAAWQLASER